MPLNPNNFNLETKIKKAISKSGYLDEQKVIVEFEKLGFFAGGNYAFEDQDEHKSREIDFIATKHVDYIFGKTGFLFYIYGEVKKTTNPLVFFERKPERRESEKVVEFIPVVASQEFFGFIDPLLDIKKILKFSELHHQAKHDFISTQFCEVDKNKAVHKNLYETLFVPLLKCVDCEISEMSRWKLDFRRDDPMYFLSLFQPIIVISGPLYSYDVNADSVSKKDYILYRRHYLSKTIKRTLVIDIVTREYLPRYISEKLLKTHQAIESSLRERMDEIIGYCLKDQLLRDQKVNEMLRKQGYPI
jgi:hypothetical protein